MQTHVLFNTMKSLSKSLKATARLAGNRKDQKEARHLAQKMEQFVKRPEELSQNTLNEMIEQGMKCLNDMNRKWINK